MGFFIVKKNSVPASSLPAVDEDPGVGRLSLALGEGGVDPVRGLEEVLLDLLPSQVIYLRGEEDSSSVIISWGTSQHYFDVEKVNVVLR